MLRKLTAAFCAFAVATPIFMVAPAFAQQSPRDYVVQAQYDASRGRPDVRWYRDGPGPRWNGNRDRPPRWSRDDDRRGWYRGHRGYRERRPGYRYHNGWWFPPAAFALGAIVGGAIANSPPPQPAYRGSNAHVQWCYDRWRSYRAYDNTYQPYNGPRRQCVSPYS